jgi:hypothetical protein
MKFRTLSACALVCACWLAASVGAGAFSAAAQDNKSTQADAKVSSGERDAAEKINKAKGGEAKLQAAAEFIKKYPKSSLRPRIAEAVAAEIAGTPEAELKISLAETYLSFFNEPTEAALVNDALLNAYINAGRTEQAFKMGSARLAKNPDDVDLLRSLTVIASNETIKGNTTYAAQGQQYGAKAIELLEADKKPEGVDDAKWASYKAEALPALYRAMGIIAYKTSDNATAMARLGKAAEMKVNDPGVYLILSELTYDDYDRLTKLYNVAPAAEKAAALAKAQAALDRVIETYAQAVGMTEGNAQYQQAHDALKEDVTKFYKFRHNNSDAGLQQLLDKYKKPATQ